jgi:sucrose-6-phosphate hydrolase SacC (GH32 family)
MKPASTLAAVLLAAGVVLALSAPRAQAPQAGDEPLRPRIHFTPPRYFMNDPNGLVYYKGEYHLFYQHNPFGEEWGHMSWGHAVSRDMLHWQHLPVALSEEGGVMIFSGSAVVDTRNSSGLCHADAADPSCLIAIYSGDGLGKETQNIAFSNDRGRTWTKYRGNPVIDLGRKDFRDPKVFWHAPTGRWIMATVLAGEHKVRFFGSNDLIKWETLSDFGPAGATGGAWECPDLFELSVEPSNERRWVLVVNINPGGVAGGSGTQYFVGAFDGVTFTNENASARTLWADYGKDFYASQSFSDIPAADGRRIWMGWISNWAYANAEPTVRWRGAQSIPRTLALKRSSDGVRLVQRPIDELRDLRVGEAAVVAGSSALPPSAEIELTLTRSDGPVGLRIFNEAGEEVTIGATSSPSEVFIDRQRSSAGPAFHADYPGRHAGPAQWKDGKLSLRIVFDRSVMEVFAADGTTVLTERAYPTRQFDRLELHPPGRTGGATARLWELRSSMP